MKTQDPGVPARYYLRMLEYLELQDIPLRRVLKHSGINPQGLQAPDAHLRLSQIESLVNVLFDDLSISNDIALDWGALLGVSTHSIVGFGMLNSPNIEHSLQFVARFFRLVMPTFSMRYVRHNGGATITWRPIVGMSPRCLDFHIESIANAAYREIRELAPGLPIFRVDLSIKEPAHKARYRKLTGASWRFACLERPGAMIHFDFDASMYPLNTADTNAFRVAEERCRALQQSVAVKGAFKSWVRMMLRDAGNGQPDLKDLAGVLNISTRTLNRHLQNEGTTFREIAGQVQHELACKRLCDPHLSVTEIALSLGFTETANFSRFFKSKQGVSPRAFRNQQLRG
nr:AraC family transcriptional regulator ligand-binding domain-containing protein [Oceanococcus sp. HetDA_MAG_MS8]